MSAHIIVLMCVLRLVLYQINHDEGPAFMLNYNSEFLPVTSTEFCEHCSRKKSQNAIDSTACLYLKNCSFCKAYILARKYTMRVRELLYNFVSKWNGRQLHIQSRFVVLQLTRNVITVSLSYIVISIISYAQ